MAFSYRDLFCGGKTFCCCLPVRMGVIVMSFLGIIFGGILSIILWFEVASTIDMTSGERAAFVVAGLVEMFLFTASILGFVGAIVRKQLFVQIYAYFIYIHFLLNIGVAAYLLYLVTHFSADANVVACQKAIKNQKAKDQCTGLLKVAQGVYFVIAAFVLLVELYGTLVVTRYLNQVKNEKRTARASRMINEEAFALVSKGKGRSSSVPAVGQPYTFSDYAVEEFDPYNIDTRPTAGSRQSFAYDGVPTHPDEVGYGGGSWTHREITEEEKARLKREEGEDAVPEPITLDDEERERQRQDIKSSMGPPSISNPRELDDLPRYTLSDPPRGSGLV